MNAIRTGSSRAVTRRSLESEDGRHRLSRGRPADRPRRPGVRPGTGGSARHPPAQPRDRATRPPAARLGQRVRAQPLPAAVLPVRRLRQGRARQADPRAEGTVHRVLGARGGGHPSVHLAAAALADGGVSGEGPHGRGALVARQPADDRLAHRRAGRQGPASRERDRARRESAVGTLVGLVGRQDGPRGAVPLGRRRERRPHEVRTQLCPPAADPPGGSPGDVDPSSGCSARPRLTCGAGTRHRHPLRPRRLLPPAVR